MGRVMRVHATVFIARSALSLTIAALAVAPGAAAADRCPGTPGGGLTLTNVAAHGSETFAVGSNGLVATARDPARWTIEPTPTRHDLRGIGWTGERWVAIGDVGAILARVGGSWRAAAGIPPLSLRAIAAGGGRVVVGGRGGAMGSDASAEGWSAVDVGTTNTLWAGTAVGSSLALAGQEATVVAGAGAGPFTDVQTFPRPTASVIAPRPFLWQLASDGNRVVAVGDFGAILEGTLAAGLRGRQTPTDEILRGVGHADGRWVAVGSGGVTLFSQDGRRWQRGTNATSADLRGVAHTRAGWVAVGDQSTVITSRNGRDWSVAVSALPCSLASVARGDGTLVAVGGSGKVLRSQDGRRWQPAKRPTRADLFGIAHGRPGFVAVGSAGTLLTSRDGRDWRRRSVPTALNLRGVAWTGSEFLVGADRGVVLSSRTGARWRRVRSSAFHSVRAFATDGRAVVAVGAGTIMRRPAPGGAWQFQQAGLQRFQTGVAYGGGRFVVVGHNGEALFSTDRGRTWTAGVSGVEVNLDTVTWTGRRFLASGEGVTIVSADGRAWAPLGLPTARSVRAWAPAGGAMVGVGDGGVRVRVPR